MPVEDVALGSRVLIRPGEQIPLDGFVIAGASRLDQSLLTGEATPGQKAVGDQVGI